jgi:hypothetical protein
VVAAGKLKAAIDEVRQLLLRNGPKASTVPSLLLYKGMDSTLGHNIRLEVDTHTQA